VQEDFEFYRGGWHLSHKGDEEKVADLSEGVSLDPDVFNLNFGFTQFLMARHEKEDKIYVQIILLEGEYQNKQAILYFHLPILQDVEQIKLEKVVVDSKK
jgi:hypothetical protein